MTPPVLSARSVTKSYGSRRVLSGVDLEVTEGAIVGIRGPSGVGKSTLLRLLAALERPDSGVVEFAGRPAWVKRRRRVPRPGFVMPVFQHPVSSLDARWPIGRTVGEPMFRAPDRRDRARELLDRVGLAGVDLDARPGELSGGQCQRVAIARALAAGPAVVLADEPTSALDVTTAAGVLHLLREVADGGTAIVLVSHDAAVLDVLADRVVRLAGDRSAGRPGEPR